MDWASDFCRAYRKRGDARIQRLGQDVIALVLFQRTVMACHKFRFIKTADLVMQLAVTKAQNLLKEYLNWPVPEPKRLVVNEIGYFAFD